MTGYLAAYDPALATPTGDYWAWRSAKLDRNLLETCHARIGAGHPLDRPNQLASTDLHGGCVFQGDDWLCFYRYYDGGRDLRGRPDRFVLLCCFVPLQDISLCDGPTLFEQAPFSTFDGEKVARGLPPDRPQVLECEIEQCLPLTNRSGEISRTWYECVESEKPFHWKLEKRADRMTAHIEWLHRKATKPDLSTANPSPRSERASASPKRKHEHTRRRVIFPTFSMFKYLSLIGLSLALGILVEWRFKVIARTTDQDSTKTINEPELRRFLETYQSTEGFPQIRTDTLLDRLDRQDWSVEGTSDRPRPFGAPRASSSVEMKRPRIDLPSGS